MEEEKHILANKVIQTYPSLKCLITPTTEVTDIVYLRNKEVFINVQSEDIMKNNFIVHEEKDNHINIRINSSNVPKPKNLRIYLCNNDNVFFYLIVGLKINEITTVILIENMFEHEIDIKLESQLMIMKIGFSYFPDLLLSHLLDMKLEFLRRNNHELRNIISHD